jgi:transposase
MSRKKQVEYAMELKLAAVRRVRAGESVRAVAEELGIRRKRLYVWKDRYAELGEAGLQRRRGGRPIQQSLTCWSIRRMA